MALNKKNQAAFAALSAAILASASGFIFVAQADVEPFVKEGLIELNTTMTDADGNVAARLVDQAAAQNPAEGGAEESEKTAVAVRNSSAFSIEDDVAMPTNVGRGRSSTTYPFDALAVGQSFFVPNTEAKPNAAKSLASTVSSATARYAEVIDGEFKTDKNGKKVPATRETRKFVVRPFVQGDGTHGARVWRTA